MNDVASQPEQDFAAAPGSRAELARLMRRTCAEIGADRYMLVEPLTERGPQTVRIITSNWVFDSIEAVGLEGIARILDQGDAVGPGLQPRAFSPSSMNFLTPPEALALREYGHAELFCQKLRVAGRRVFALFSSEAPRSIDPGGLARAHMICCYALEQWAAVETGRRLRDPLSERERECLLWVSEGKTTDEVALILGVSSNTVNSYVAHAIQKFGASNRAMAIATAIRSGII